MLTGSDTHVFKDVWRATSLLRVVVGWLGQWLDTLAVDGFGQS